MSEMKFKVNNLEQEKQLLFKLNEDNIPKHVAIIMDGNGRWAHKRGLPRYAGHQAGVKALKETIKACLEVGIKHLSVFAFSTASAIVPTI